MAGTETETESESDSESESESDSDSDAESTAAVFGGKLTTMKPTVTANDLWPLVSKLSPQEQMRLAKLALRAAARASDRDAAAYSADPVGAKEFSSDHDPLAWEGEGWEDVDAPR